MTNDETWLTAAQAAKILRVTERQVNRYGADGRLRTQRAGRRVSYLASDVARLADELQVDKRPLPVPRQQGDGALISPQIETISKWGLTVPEDRRASFFCQDATDSRIVLMA
jgi:hypothetical protein